MKKSFAIGMAFTALIFVLPSSLIGAEKKSEGVEAPAANKKELKKHSFRFESPTRIEAGGKIVAVESPGYACPTMADVDGDGKEDLVVGQFRNGNMQFCKNISSEGQSPRFAEATWLKSGDDRIEVPGVW